MSATVLIEALAEVDYGEAARFWASIPEIGFTPAFDTAERVGAYLRRNPGLSTAARAGGALVGAVLCGHDGRRGSLYHMAVAPQARRQGVGRRMVDRCLAGLRAEGITTAFLFVHVENGPAAAFWSAVDWIYLPHIDYYACSF